MLIPRRGDLLDEAELHTAVLALQHHALALGQIPIAGVVSLKRNVRGRTLHEYLGGGHNLLRSGLPAIHGETGAIINTGRLPPGVRWQDLTVTSSLNPCNFCQRTLCAHLGVRDIRILDSQGLAVPPTTYDLFNITPTRIPFAPSADLFREWVNSPENALIWNRDIGLFAAPTLPPLDVSGSAGRLKTVFSLLHALAAGAVAAGEAPIAAAVLDAEGEVLSASGPRIIATNDPTSTAPVSAWRGAGARDHWKDKTLLLTAGPDHFTYAMFQTFNFGQLVIASTAAHPGQLTALRSHCPPARIHVLADTTSDPLLTHWLPRTPLATLREQLGADFTPHRTGR